MPEESTKQFVGYASSVTPSRMA